MFLDSGWDCRTYRNVVPLGVVQVVLVDAQLRAGQRHAGHLVLQRANLEGAGNHVVQEQL